MDKVGLFPALSCSVNNELTAPSLVGGGGSAHWVGPAHEQNQR